MGNIIQRGSDASDGMAVAVWAQLAGPEKTQKHAVQFYEADKPLPAKNVRCYLWHKRCKHHPCLHSGRIAF
jgi:hypothetical protein